MLKLGHDKPEQELREGFLVGGRPALTAQDALENFDSGKVSPKLQPL